MVHSPGKYDSTSAALEAVRRGFQPIPIPDKAKRPSLTAWTKVNWSPDDLEDVQEKFDTWGDEGQTNVGLLLGEPSSGLIDIDLDHSKTVRLKDFFLPSTPMRSGRAGRPNSHYWYQAEEGTLPGTRRYKMAGPGSGEVSVELRSSLAQTIIPPSVHPTGEDYTWSGDPWGGEAGPRKVNGKVLAVQVALLGLGTVLIDKWPVEGSRHEAYLALAGGLLRYGQGVHPYWERNLAVLIGALAEATNDDDGPEARISEVLETTVSRLRTGREATGFGVLAEILSDDHVRQVRLMAREVEALAGFAPDTVVESETPSPLVTSPASSITDADLDALEDSMQSDLEEMPAAKRDPLGERVATWEPVDLGPFLAGEVVVPEPTVLVRSDGQGLMYQGRVNMLYGPSESAKSWVALHTAQQEMGSGSRVMYLDFEDEPVSTLDRLRVMGAESEDIRSQFSYIRPEEPLEAMQRSRWGAPSPTELGKLNQTVFMKAMERLDPSLIVADGMTVLYGLHGLDANDAVSTDVITGWLKQLTRNGRTTVIVIDHTTKGAEKGAMPIGSQHKVAMVQGTLLQVWPIQQPMPGRVGRVELVVLKDRPGKVREISETAQGKAQVTAEITMDSTEPGVTAMSIDPPEPSPETLEKVDLERSREAERSEVALLWEERIMWCFGGELDLPLQMTDFREMLGTEENYTDRRVRDALGRMERQGMVEATGQTRGRTYTLTVGVSGYEA